MQIKYINRYPDAIVVGVWISSSRSTIRSNTILSRSLFFFAWCSHCLIGSVPFAAVGVMMLLLLLPLRRWKRRQWRLLLLFVMVIVNVYDSVCWFGYAHQKLDKLLYYFGFCAWDLFCVFCSMNCFQTSEFNSPTLSLPPIPSVSRCVCLFPHFLSFFLPLLLRRRGMVVFSSTFATAVLSLLSLFSLF